MGQCYISGWQNPIGPNQFFPLLAQQYVPYLRWNLILKWLKPLSIDGGRVNVVDPVVAQLWSDNGILTLLGQHWANLLGQHWANDWSDSDPSTLLAYCWANGQNPGGVLPGWTDGGGGGSRYFFVYCFFAFNVMMAILIRLIGVKCAIFFYVYSMRKQDPFLTT